MKLQEIITILMSLLAVVSSFYAVWVSKKSAEKKVKLDFLYDHLKLLKQGREDLSSSHETDDIGIALYNQFVSALKVVDNTSPLFPENIRDKIRKQRKILNDSYVRYAFNESKGVTWKESSEELYGEDELPAKMSDFIASVRTILDEEIDRVYSILSKHVE